MTNKERKKIEVKNMCDLESDLLNTMYVTDLMELISEKPQESYTFEDTVKAVLRAYKLATLRARQQN